MTELVQRLRLHARVLNEQEHAMLSQDCTAAADMIEQQAGEIERLKYLIRRSTEYRLGFPAYEAACRKELNK